LLRGVPKENGKVGRSMAFQHSFLSDCRYTSKKGYLESQMRGLGKRGGLKIGGPDFSSIGDG